MNINPNHTVKGCSFYEVLIYYIFHHLNRKMTLKLFRNLIFFGAAFSKQNIVYVFLNNHIVVLGGKLRSE